MCQADEDTMRTAKCQCGSLGCGQVFCTFNPGLNFQSVNMKRLSLFLILLVFSVFRPLAAQVTYLLDPESTITIDGTSNKSDFSVVAEEFYGSVTIQEGAPVAATLTVVVAAMKSGRSSIMDRLMRGALKAEEHPEIVFVLESATASQDGGWDLSGVLDFAGVTNPVIIRLTQATDEAGPKIFTGSYEMDMREYGINPPTAMFGALLTKAVVTIHFNLILSE